MNTILPDNLFKLKQEVKERKKERKKEREEYLFKHTNDEIRNF
jgi:hypothetical protein